MLVEFSRLWPWLLACFAIGAAAGALTRRAPENGVVARWLVWTALAFGVGVLVVRLGALAAAAPLVEGALAAYAVLIIGAALGALARHRSIWAHEGWAVGLVAASLLWVGAVVIGQSDPDERRRFAAPTNSAGADMPPATSPPADETAAAGAAISPVRAQGPSASATAAVSGGMTLADCRTALEASSTPGELAFAKGSARLTSLSARALDKAAAVIRRCPEYATIEISGHVRGSGARAPNDALAQRRAEAAMGYLEGRGVGGRRLVASHGEPDQAENRALTFEVR
ncbi:OmpA family protein [Methylocystis sp. SC2]|uniref:OmpA family protein n=1 Tax=Methylocystis sp. (strain SC2) TaxID=187303 RepID=UPI00027AEABC|nr:OmpA family protein [Methylocystis sp. SC2]CCJ07423.1 OmpA/MotB domain protein [Methylocystis sp. SC2]